MRKMIITVSINKSTRMGMALMRNNPKMRRKKKRRKKERRKKKRRKKKKRKK